jgi:acyl-coenzyme A synthetase/AMP-(fatty) acid ligase
MPEEFIRVAELPKGPQGKILRKEVRKIYAKAGVPLT